MYMYYIFAKTLCQYAPLFSIPKVPLSRGAVYAHGERETTIRTVRHFRIYRLCARNDGWQKCVFLPNSTRRLYCVPCSRQITTVYSIYDTLENDAPYCRIRIRSFRDPRIIRRRYFDIVGDYESLLTDLYS